jgi:hypothetical protein
VLENSHFWVAVTTWANMPTLQIQFKAECLYEYEPDKYGVIVRSLLDYFVAPPTARIKVSRCDVAADFQGEGFKLPEMQDLSGRARHRARYFRGSAANTVTFGRRNQALQVQLYLKSEELAVSEKAWMYDVWRASGAFDEELPVWRAEVRLFRDGLRSFKVDTLGDLLSCLGDVVSYAAGTESGSWFRALRPEDRGHNMSRRASATWWRRVSAALGSPFEMSGRKRKGWEPTDSFTRSVELAGAHMSKAVAIARVAGWDLGLTPGDAGRSVGRMYGQMLETRAHRWADRVNFKMADMRGRVWRVKPSPSPVPGIYG